MKDTKTRSVGIQTSDSLVVRKLAITLIQEGIPGGLSYMYGAGI